MTTGAAGILARWSPRHYSQSIQGFLTPDRLESPRFLLTFWFVARLVVISSWAVLTTNVQGDVSYYYDRISAMGQLGAAQTMPEYPTPALWVLYLPWLLGFGSATGYMIAFACLMLALDAAFTYSLWHFGGRWRGQAVVIWTVLLAFIGPTVYLRFDLITSVLAGWALIAVWRRRPVIAGALIGVAATVKLWPALLWPALCGGSRSRAWRVTVAMAVTGGALALGSVAWAGWGRLLSPLNYQSDRGLQVESVVASVPMLLRSLHIGDHAVTVSRYLAFEIWGTGVPFWLGVASVAVIAGYAAIGVAYVAWFVRGHGQMIEGCVLTLFAVSVLIVTNKTFSPQYILWFAGPLAVTAMVIGASSARTRQMRAEKRRFLKITWLILAAALATIIVFPIGYAPLVRDTTDWWHWLRLPVSLVLVLRNVLMVWTMIELAVWTVSFLKPRAWTLRRRRAEQPIGDVSR